MSGSVQWSDNGNSYSHGIVCRDCVVKKLTEVGSAVYSVHVGMLVEIHKIQGDDVLFCVVKNDVPLEYESYICKKGDVLYVPENLWGPLLTVDGKARLSIVQDKELAEALGNVTVGNSVKVIGPDNKDICIGSVTFKNSIARLGVGVYFGLKITHPKNGLDIIKNKISLLEPGTKGFPRGCDVVVSIDKILPLKKDIDNHLEREIEKFSKSKLKNCKSLISKSKVGSYSKEKNECSLKSSHHGNAGTGSNHQALINELKSIYETPLSFGEDLVCPSDGKRRKGTLKCSGPSENSSSVKPRYDNPSGGGIISSEELYSDKISHAPPMPHDSFMKLSGFEMNNSKDYSNQQKTTNNNNYNNLRSNNPCCSLKHNIEDKGKMLKTHSFQNSKCTNSSHGGDYQYKNFKEDRSEQDFDFNPMCKTECKTCLSQAHYPSRSFDSCKPSEKKIGNNRLFKSMDNDPTESKEDIYSNLQNSFVSVQKSPSKDLDDLFSQNRTDYYELRCSSGGSSSSYYNNDKHIESFDLNPVMFGDHTDYSLPVKKKNTHNNDSEVWESRNSEQSNSDESDEYYDSPKPIPNHLSSDNKLGQGSVVEIMHKGQPYYGVIRWIGNIPNDGEGRSSHLTAGIEMEEERVGFTDGTFRNIKYFHCNPKKALFVPLSECRKDSRFADESNKYNISMKMNSFGQLHCPVVKGTIPPINRRVDLEAICGKNRGIQGHHNSCYLDATLFAMFAFTSVFDSLLYRPPTVTDIPQYVEVQRVLKEEIVNPLRKNLYVRADRVMKLRTLLENLSSVSGLTCDEKDPEEFLNSLLAQILKAEPFLKLSSGQETFHYQLFVEKDERLTLPSVQQLFEQSFVASDLKLKQIPSCLIIQMPRFGKSYKMYSRIIPPQLLDVTDIIENSPRQCTVCGKSAEFECRDCFYQNGIGNGLESISFCKKCLDTSHSHISRIRHNYRQITVPFEFCDLQEHCTIPRMYMELFAVVCIETSHYVAFVKCGTGSDAPWFFFDSMADRKGEQNGYNIPEVVACPDLPYWLSEEGMKTLNEMKDDRQLPEYAKRLLCDAYMCMYQSPDIMMYR